MKFAKGTIVAIVLVMVLIAIYFLARPIVKFSANDDVDLDIKIKVHGVHETILKAVINKDVVLIDKNLSASFLATGMSGQYLIAYLDKHLKEMPIIYNEGFFSVIWKGIGNQRYMFSEKTDYILDFSVKRDTYIILSTIVQKEYEYLLKTNYVKDDGQWKLEGCDIAFWGYNGMRVDDVLKKGMIALEQGKDMSAYLYSIIASAFINPLSTLKFRDFEKAKAFIDDVTAKLQQQLPTVYNISFGKATVVDVRLEMESEKMKPIVYIKTEPKLMNEQEQLEVCNDVGEQFLLQYPDVLEFFGKIKVNYVTN